MLPFVPLIGRFLALAILPRFITKWASNKIISGKIGERVENVRSKIKEWYLQYRLNIYLTIIFNSLIVGITLAFHYFFMINNIIIFIISSLCIFMIIRTIVRFIKSIVCTIIPNWDNIFHYSSVFFMDLFGGWGLSGSIRDTIHVAFSKIYNDNTNAFGRGVHTVFSKLRFVKSYHEISEEVQDEFYGLITGFAVRLIIYKLIAFIVYCLVFTFILKPFVFTNILKMNVLEVIVYPFTIAIPTIFRIIAGG